MQMKNRLPLQQLRAAVLAFGENCGGLRKADSERQSIDLDHGTMTKNA
jgi:hypothetical protein